MTAILYRHMDAIRFNLGRSIQQGEVTTAVHEAGHVVVALLSGLGVTEVTIEPRDGRYGHCLTDWPDVDGRDARRLVAIAQVSCDVAGEEAEAFLDGALRGWGRGLGGDRRNIREALDGADWGDMDAATRGDLLRWVRRDVRATLTRHEAEVDGLAVALLRWRTLDGDDVRAIVPRVAAAGDARRQALEDEVETRRRPASGPIGSSRQRIRPHPHIPGLEVSAMAGPIKMR